LREDCTGLAKGNAGRSMNALTATFNTAPSCYTLATMGKVTGSGKINVDPPSDDGSQYIVGKVVTLSALSTPGHLFSKWTGSSTSTSNPFTVTMNSDKAYTANFERIRLLFLFRQSISKFFNGRVY
jgi:uncharacterized repeat protein (TIGR02543 family)